ncbi:MAG TPA: hypothetical protein VNA25_04215 [Phycisphaerae bacterium]|nr:hypothetical protein [Phycisphaerae bacterium]
MKPVHNPLRETSFFRRTSNALLKRFFEHHAVLADLDWDGRDEADVTEVYDAYRGLSDDLRSKVEEDLENLKRTLPPSAACLAWWT